MTRTTVLIAAHANYSIRLSIVDRQVHNHAHCLICQDIGSVIEAEVYLPVEAGDGHLSKKHIDCCVGCVIPVIDSEPYVASDQTIEVEVYRGSTLRPF
jgi:DUF1680 family protein